MRSILQTFSQLHILATQAVLKRPKKLDLSTDIDMLLMVKKELEEEYAASFIDMQKIRSFN